MLLLKMTDQLRVTLHVLASEDKLVACATKGTHAVFWLKVKLGVGGFSTQMVLVMVSFPQAFLTIMEML